MDQIDNRFGAVEANGPPSPRMLHSGVGLPSPLAEYARDFTPDLEAAPRTPVFAVNLMSHTGVPFTLVREAVEKTGLRRGLAWFVWRGRDCVGYVGTNLTTGVWRPFTPGFGPAITRRHVVKCRTAKIYRSFIADGTGIGTGARTLALVASRGMGIMWRAYAEIVRELSESGWALSATHNAQSPEALALWRRLEQTPGLTIIRSRRGTHAGLQFGAILRDHLAAFTPAPNVARSGV